MFNKQAFTLLELLVVVGIIGLLSSMILVIPDSETPEQQVELAATQLESSLKLCRKLALETKNNYGFVFHIQNSGDNHVWKNYSQIYDAGDAAKGRHWYAIIAPDTTFNTRAKNEPPIPGGGEGDRGYDHLYSLKRALEILTVGDRNFLPFGTRILAIGDLDTGNYCHNDYIRGDKGVAHPRPWHGFYDSGRLYAFGGYDPDVDTAFKASHSNINTGTTGFCYRGGDEEPPYDPVLDCLVNPPTTWGYHYDAARSRYPGDSSGGKLPDTGQDPELTVVGKPRPILDGYGLDYMFIFKGDGGVVIYKNTRVIYYEPSWNGTKKYRAKFGLEHMNVKTGGYYITVARDVDPEDTRAGSDQQMYQSMNATTNQPDYHLFQTVDDAFKSITPFRRIFIQEETGSISIRHPLHPDAYLEAQHLEQHDPYPVKTIPEY